MPTPAVDLARLLADLEDLERRRLDPLYTALARDLQQAVKAGGLAGLQNAYQLALRRLTSEEGAVLELTVRHAAEVAGLSQAQIRTRFPAASPDQRFLPGLSQLPSLDELTTTLPTAVAERMLTLPDKWGFKLSERIWRNAQQTRAELHQVLLTRLRHQASAESTLSALRTLQRDDPRLPRHFQVLEREARAALTGVPEAKARLAQALARARATVETRVGGVTGTRQLQRQVLHELAQAVKGGSAAAVDAAISLFIEGRQRYRAQVLARNTQHLAYWQSTLEIYNRSDFVLAVRWRVRGQRRHTDECDLRARVDVGLGPGVFYKQRVPFPAHVSCRCRLEPLRVAPEQVEGAEPYRPDDPLAYARQIEQLEGPLATEANRLGRQYAQEPETARQAITALLSTLAGSFPA